MHFVLFLGYLLWKSSFFAHANSILSESVAIEANRNRISEVAKTIEWRRLLYFNDFGTGKSYAEITPEKKEHGKVFFLAGEAGRSDPAVELVATLKAFQEPVPQLLEVREAHARCQFPARFIFLQTHFPKLRSLPNIHCLRFVRFARVLVPKQVDLVFAAAYVNSPASMYGHTLLRLKRIGKTQGHELLDYIVAFGANIQGATGLSYVINGLTGGFHGEFTTVPYYLKVQEYLHMESRDLWSYPIYFTAEEQVFLVAHLWELRLVQFPYFFLGANCSFFLLRFLEAIRPEWNFSNQLPDWVIPVDTIRKMQEEGAIGKATVRASRHSRLKFLRARLNSVEQNLAYDLIHESKMSSVKQSLAALEKSRQIEITDTAYEYFRYRNPIGSEGKKDAELIAREQALLALRAELPKTKVDVDKLRKANPPESAHPSNRVAMEYGLISLESDTKFARLAWRPAIHDLLDELRGMDAYAEQEVLHARFQLEPSRGRFFLDTLNLLRVRSLAPIDSWITQIAWRMTFGLAQAKDVRPHCRDRNCVYGRLEGGAGASLEIDSQSKSFLFSLLTLNIHGGAPFAPNYRFGPALETGFRLRPFSSMGILGEWKWQKFFWGDSGDFASYRGEVSWRIRSNFSLRFRGERTRNYREWSVGAFVYY